jgi:hypothetical protein
LTIYILRTRINGVDLSMLNQQILQRSPEEVQALSSQLTSLLVILLLTIIFFLLALLLSWTLSRGLMWTTVLKKKFTKHYFKKFVGLNVLFGIVLAILIFVFSKLVELSYIIYIFYITFAIFIYFTAIIYTYFTKKEHQIFNSIGQGLTIGVKKLKHLIIPSLLIIVLLAVISIASFLLQKVYSSIFIIFILIILYSAWARPYFISQAEKVL